MPSPEALFYINPKGTEYGKIPPKPCEKPKLPRVVRIPEVEKKHIKKDGKK